MPGKRRDAADEVTIVLDENIASDELLARLTPAAARCGARVELITAHFERGTADAVWLPVAAARRWAVVTCDVHVKRRPAEKQILMQAGVSVFILRGNLNGDQIASALSRAVPALCQYHRNRVPPLICHVSVEGAVTVIHGQRRGAIKR